MGHKVTTAESAESALEVYESSIKNKINAFDLMVTDFQMGGMDGLDLSKFVRKHNTQLPILMVTAYGAIQKNFNSVRVFISIYLASLLLTKN